jgi:hypothetical protein
MAFEEPSGRACVWRTRGLCRTGCFSPVVNPRSDKATNRHLVTMRISFADVEPLKSVLPT